ncbi:MAG: nucleoside kinase [Clostridia bacterium]|nr:nucleoside kinase [Clostridia bacterium]
MKITYKDKTFNVEPNTRIKDVLKKEIENSENKIITCICNNKVKSLNHKVHEDCNIELLDYTNKEGKRVYVRGALYIMAKAFKEEYPEAKLTVNYQLSNSMYCVIDNMEITDQMINRVKTKMEEIIEKDLEIKKVVMSQDEARKFYEKEKNKTGILLQLNKKDETDKISLYYCEDYYNYFFGVMPISTGLVNVFDLVKYKDGFLIKYPSREEPNKLAQFKETKKLLSTLNEYDEIYKILKIDTVNRLNKRIEEDKGKETIILSEALHEKKISDIADKIVNNKSTKIVLIAGPSSSGKTTFANRLGIQLMLNGKRPVTISVDNYFVEREENPRDEFGNYDFECLEALDVKLLNNHIQRLLAGEEVEIPTFDFTDGHKKYNGNTLKLEADDILVMEGIHCLNDKLTMSIPKEQKYKVYISDLTVLNLDYYNNISTTDTRLIRRIVRDNNFRGYSALQTIKTWYSVNRGESKYIFPYQEEADTMFNSSLIYELSVLKDYAIPLLKEIDNSNPECAEATRLYNLLKYFNSIPEEYIPRTSLIREFIGGSAFNV